MEEQTDGKISCSWIGNINVKIIILLKEIYRFTATPIDSIFNRNET